MVGSKVVVVGASVSGVVSTEVVVGGNVVDGVVSPVEVVEVIVVVDEGSIHAMIPTVTLKQNIV